MSTRSRGDKGEAFVRKKLAGIKEYHKVINDITFLNEKTEMTHQVDHILVHPHGVFIIETKNYFGKIISNTGEPFWLKEIKGERTRISNPLKQNKSHAFVVSKILKRKYEVIPVVVFVKNNAPYIGDENVININDLKIFIDSYPYQKELTKEEINEIYKTIKSQKSDISKKEHIENIGYLKQINEEIKKEIAYAIESGTCPRCDHKMVSSGFEYHCSNCDFKFKL
ncbi:MAG: NERD domain-containing protein [Bacilli bacterium]|nr:NERD domain-containing protein [Bacilli bacterium]